MLRRGNEMICYNIHYFIRHHRARGVSYEEWLDLQELRKIMYFNGK
jgi:hypothetical protein